MKKLNITYSESQNFIIKIHFSSLTLTLFVYIHLIYTLLIFISIVMQEIIQINYLIIKNY